MDKKLLKKIGDIAGNVVMYIFLAVCIVSIIMTVFGKRDEDGTSELFGYQMRLVVSDSMAKSEFTDVSNYKIKHIPLNSMVFIKLVPDDPAEADQWYRDVEVGDVLTFRYVYTNQVTITHRVVDKVEKETGGFLIYLEGDNKNSDSKQLVQTINTASDDPLNYVEGKVVGSSVTIGNVISFLQMPLAIVLIIILPCFVIILIEVLRLTKMFRGKREKEKMDLKEKEIEELRRKLESLERQNAEKAASEVGDKE